MNAILLHGSCDKEEFLSDEYPTLSNAHWFPWLQKQLVTRGINTQTPEMPTPYDGALNFTEWANILEGNDISTRTIIVAHSTGTGFILKWLSEHPNVGLAALFLVSPYGLSFAKHDKEFYACELDTKLLERIGAIHIFYSIDDSVADVAPTTKYLLEKIPGIVEHKFEHYNHFTTEYLKENTFPELLQAIGFSTKNSRVVVP